MIEIDGAQGEGGGQIIRTCMTLAAITKKSIYIKNIRVKRRKSGLQPQHLTACYAVQTLCNGKLEASLGAQELFFQPGEIIAGNYQFDIGTAGSVVLVAQTLIPLLLTAKATSNIRLIGGTHVLHSPSVDYFQQVFLPAIKKFGAKIHAQQIKTGFYNAGGGIMDLEIFPSPLQGCLSWKSAKLPQAIIRIGKLPLAIAEREKTVLTRHSIKEIAIFEEDTLSPGNAITLWQGYNGSYIPGERGKLAERVAQEAVEFLQAQNQEVDSHLADQLLLYAFLADGKTRYTTSKITSHFNTNLHFIMKFIPRRSEIEMSTVTIY